MTFLTKISTKFGPVLLFFATLRFRVFALNLLYIHIYEASGTSMESKIQRKTQITKAQNQNLTETGTNRGEKNLSTIFL